MSCLEEREREREREHKDALFSKRAGKKRWLGATDALLLTGRCMSVFLFIYYFLMREL